MPVNHSITSTDGPEGHPPEQRIPPLDVTLDHVFAVDPDRIMNSVPQFMHVPFVVISAPPETNPGNTLDASHYRVTSVDVANRRVQLELKVGGTFADPFIKIRGARAEIKGPNGGAIALFSPGEYSDAAYLKADVPIDGLGLHRVTVVGINSIAREGTSYMRVHVGIKKQFADALANVRREMLRLENGSVPAPGSPAAAVLNSLRAAETSPWQRALEDPAVQIRHVQKRGRTIRALRMPGNSKSACAATRRRQPLR